VAGSLWLLGKLGAYFTVLGFIYTGEQQQHHPITSGEWLWVPLPGSPAPRCCCC
jgi:hypothetical protein